MFNLFYSYILLEKNRKNLILKLILNTFLRIINGFLLKVQFLQFNCFYFLKILLHI